MRARAASPHRAECALAVFECVIIDAHPSGSWQREREQLRRIHRAARPRARTDETIVRDLQAADRASPVLAARGRRAVTD